MISKRTFKKLLCDLDTELESINKKYIIIIIGASALLAMDTISRATVDIDIIDPEIDTSLFRAAIKVGEKNNLDYGWLNSSATVFAKELPKFWRKRTKIFYNGKYLTVKVLGRNDLVLTKIFAAIERSHRDLEDLFSLKPTKLELNYAKKILLKRNQSKLFQERLKKVFKKLTLTEDGNEKK